jgi:hypothetical protein
MISIKSPPKLLSKNKPSAGLNPRPRAFHSAGPARRCSVRLKPRRNASARSARSFRLRLAQESNHPHRTLLRAGRERSRGRAPRSAMNSRRFMSGMGDFLPYALSAPADRPVRSVFRHLSLSQRGRLVLGADLNCSESRRWPAPQMPPVRPG